MRSFDHFACIDWSGAKGRWQRGIAVAMCDASNAAPILITPPQHHWTRADACQWLLQLAQERRNVLIGLDLSFALPFADCDAYFPGWEPSPPDAKALWQLVDGLSDAEENFAVSHFIDHPEIARHFRQLGNCGDLFGKGRGRLRYCEANGQAELDGINPYSCFNLVGAAQVGKSSLTGMRILHHLNGAIPIWPFDPIPATGPVIVEIYTSIAARASGVLPKGKSKIADPDILDAALDAYGSHPHARFAKRYIDHATDAMVTSAWLRARADLSDYWTPKRMNLKIAQTEGWTFGVV